MKHIRVDPQTQRAATVEMAYVGYEQAEKQCPPHPEI